MIELKYFRLIVSITEEGSLTKAAEKLCLTQSALSHQLKELEELLGFAVFFRLNRKLVPTAHGYNLIKNGRRIIADVGKILELASSHNPITLNNTLRISVECYSSFSWLPQILGEFNKNYPNTEVSIKSSISHDYVDDLVNEACDIALVVKRKSNSELQFHELIQDRLVVAMSNKNRLANNSGLSFQSLANQTLITHCKGNEIEEIFEHIVPPKSFKPYRVIQITTTEGIIDLVDEGIGVAVMSEWAIQKYCMGREISLIPFEKEKSIRPWYLATKKSNCTNPGMEHFVNLMKGYNYSS